MPFLRKTIPIAITSLILQMLAHLTFLTETIAFEALAPQPAVLRFRPMPGSAHAAVIHF